MTARKLHTGEIVTSHGNITAPKSYSTKYPSRREEERIIARNRIIVFSILGAISIFSCALIAKIEYILVLAR